MEDRLLTEPSRGEFENWKNTPISQWFLDRIQKLIRDKESSLGEGSLFDRSDMVKTQTNTAEAIGFIEACKECIEIVPENDFM